MENIQNQLNCNGNRRGMSPNSRKNLETGRNKGGRPKDEDAISSILRKIGSTIPPYPKPNGEKETRTRREIACERLWDIAVHGEPKQVISAMYFITERTEGKVLQPVGGENGEPIKYELTVKDTETKDLTERIIKGGSVVSNISLS